MLAVLLAGCSSDAGSDALASGLVHDAVGIDDEAVYVLARQNGGSSDAVLLRIVPQP